MNEKPKILIVDDRPENLLALEHVLDDLDVQVCKANSGNEALSLTIRDEFALILLDVQMPGMDGYEVASLLGKRAVTARVPIIFVTAIDKQEEHAIRGYSTGAVDFLFKPVNPVILKNKVSVFLELYRSRRALEAKNNELVEFAHLAAHDLKAPLRQIKSFSEFVQEDLANERFKDVEDGLQKIVNGTNRMTRLVDDLLAFAELGAIDDADNCVDLSDVVADALVLLEEPCRVSGAKITTSPLPIVRGNKTALVQLMQNLIGNAVKFCGEEPPVIVISSDDQSDSCLIRVSDNGIGIEAKYYDLIFTPLKRLQTPRKVDGSGLGLANCKKIVERHGGRIWVEPNSRGRGSSFCFTLPSAHPLTSGQPNEADRRSDVVHELSGATTALKD